MPDAVYLILCLVVPPVWGVVAARLFDVLASRRKKSATTEPDDERMYHI
jgi:hypothetical protein